MAAYSVLDPNGAQITGGELTAERLLDWAGAELSVGGTSQMTLHVRNGVSGGLNYNLIVTGTFTQNADDWSGTVTSIRGTAEAGGGSRSLLTGISVSLATLGGFVSTPSLSASSILSGADTLTGSLNGSDTMKGYGGADNLNGSGGHDTLDGGPGADTLNGGTGNDTLIGGNGADTLAGQTGDDTYRYTAASHAASGETIVDTGAADFDRVAITTSVDLSRVSMTGVDALQFAHASGLVMATVLARQSAVVPAAARQRRASIR